MFTLTTIASVLLVAGSPIHSIDTGDSGDSNDGVLVGPDSLWETALTFVDAMVGPKEVAVGAINGSELDDAGWW